jgi:uncharacterized protein DUF6505
MNLARAIHLDESDTLVFHRPARTGEWVISGGFEFSNWDQSDLTGKARQAFTNGWLGLESFGRATFAAVTRIEPVEFDTLADNLAQHFVSLYGAPDLDAARAVALEELQHMADMCDGQSANTLLTVARELSDAGVNEAFRIIEGREAELIQIVGDGCN